MNKNSIKDTTSKEREGLINESLVFEDIFLKRSTLPKLLNDKVFFETETEIFVLEGVLFNKAKTMGKTQVLTLLSLMKNYFHSTEWLQDDE